MLFPSTCPGCGRPGEAPCAPCVAALEPAPTVPPSGGLDAVVGLLAYTGPARAMVAAIKSRHHRDGWSRLGLGLARVARAEVLPVHPVGAVTWAPTSPARRRARGYDQSELLARAVAGELGLPVRRLLRRVPGPPQTGLGRAERLLGPRFVPLAPVGGGVLVVDDVHTTGATLAAAATALRSAGAPAVAGAVLAVAGEPEPLPGRPRTGPGPVHR